MELLKLTLAHMQKLVFVVATKHALKQIPYKLLSQTQVPEILLHRLEDYADNIPNCDSTKRLLLARSVLELTHLQQEMS